MKGSPILRLFKPNSIVVIGEVDQPASTAATIINNITRGSFLGPVMRIGYASESFSDTPVFASVETLPITPDLAILCCPFHEAPAYLEALGKRGVPAAMVTSQINDYTREVDLELRLDIGRAAKNAEVRLLGPNSLGFINTSIGLNASLSHRDVAPGKVAFVSQSDSLFTTFMDWAELKGIGLSHCISIGDRFDLNFGHVLDFLNADFNTRAVLLYIESVDNVRMFMSAARILALNKPLLLMKAGRSLEASHAASIHADKLLRPDEIYDAAFRRAGMLRVDDMETLLATMETLSIVRPTKAGRGNRLAILTNGATPAFLAMDTLVLSGGRLAAPTAETLGKLELELPGIWSQGNPLVLKNYCTPEQYGAALRLLLADPQVDAVVAMQIPTNTSTPEELARQVVHEHAKSPKMVLASWLGQGAYSESDKILYDGGIPCYSMPTEAVKAFLNLVEYRRNQEMLMQVPTSLPEEFDPRVDDARMTVGQVVREGRTVLEESEARQLMDAYQIPYISTYNVDTLEEAIDVAETQGYPVVLKVMAPGLDKSSIGCVALNIRNEKQLLGAAGRIKTRFEEKLPGHEFVGYTVQPMAGNRQTHELFVQVVSDPVFGPVMRFGQGGNLAEIFPQRLASLLPLNMNLAHELVSRSDVYRLLAGYQDHPPVDMPALCLFLVKLAQIMVDMAEVTEITIDPLFADDHNIVAQEAIVKVAYTRQSGADRLAIRPYPKELEETVVLRDGRQVLLRPIRPEDEPEHREFFNRLSAEDRRTRFFGNIAEMPHSEMIRYTQIDYDREMAFLAVGPDNDGRISTLGVGRAMTNPDSSEAEFAVTTRSDLKRLGLGRVLLDKVIRYCRSRGLTAMVGSALDGNEGMIALAERMGFVVHKDFDDDIYEFYLKL